MWKILLSFALALTCSAQVFSPEIIGALAAPRAFNPSNDIAGMLLWLQADSLSNNADGTAIQLWPDISGRGNHFTNETAARSPYITNNVLNGHSAIRFPGSSIDFRWLSNALGFATGVTNAEMFMVVRSEVKTALANADVPWNMKLASGSESAHPSTASKLQVQFGTRVPITYTADVTNNYANTGIVTNYHIWNVQIRENQMISRYNGDVVLGLDYLANAGIGFSNIMWLARSANNGSTWNGFIAEVMIYSNATTTTISSTDREKIYSYLSNRYSISYTNPAISVTPSNFPGLVAWWRASDLATNDNTPITNWVDRLGAFKWTNMAVGTTLPLYKSTALNGQPGLWFHSTTSNQTMFLNGTINLTNYTILIIARYTNIVIAMAGEAANASQWITQQSSANKNWSYRNPAFLEGAFPRPQQETRMDSWTRNGVNTTLMQNATNAITGSSVTAVQAVNVLVPTGLNCDAIIGDIVIFQGTVTPEQITKLYYQCFRDTYSLP